MLKLWGRTNSINVQKVLWCLEELGLPYERVDAGGPFGVVDTPAYRTLNPNGRVPVIEEDGFVLWESNAIVRYVAARHDPGGLWPSDLRRVLSISFRSSSSLFYPTLPKQRLDTTLTPPGTQYGATLGEA